MDAPADITGLLSDIDAGVPGAMDTLMDTLYDDLRRMARSHLRHCFGSGADAVTLEPAALVNEAFMRLVRQHNAFDNRGHFFSIATRMMLRVLSDYQREKRAAKRGGHIGRITLDLDRRPAPHVPTGMGAVDVEALAEALDALEAFDPRKAEIVKMRVVWDMEIDAISESLGVSASTIDRDWRFARAWIADRVGLDHPPGAEPDPGQRG